jgi:rhamnogalacturonan hydrolase
MRTRYIDSYWSGTTTQSGDGVQLHNITFTDWHGTEADGAERGPVKVLCPHEGPCYDIYIDDFAVWTEESCTQWYSCESAFGEGFCLRSASVSSYAVSTKTVSTAPTSYSAATMVADLTTAFGFTVPLPVPTILTSFFPGKTPISALLG